MPSLKLNQVTIARTNLMLADILFKAGSREFPETLRRLAEKRVRASSAWVKSLDDMPDSMAVREGLIVRAMLNNNLREFERTIPRKMKRIK